MLQRNRRYVVAAAVLATLAVGSVPQSHAASHREAALVAQDPGADSTDFYAFVSNNAGGTKVLNLIANYIPAEEPGAGPNWYRLSDDVLYEIHVENDATMVGGAPHFTGKPNLSYQFRFHTVYQDPNTILTYGRNGGAIGPVTGVGSTTQNEFQTYTVSLLNHDTGITTQLASGLVVPPNNIGNTTPLYNVGGNGSNVPVEGATTTAQLDPYTTNSIYPLPGGGKVFVGQRLDAFFFDIDATFDLLSLRNPGVNTVKGFNTHSIALQIPVSQLATKAVPILGTYTSASRQAVTNRSPLNGQTSSFGQFVQESRLANPGTNEVLIPAAKRDAWNQTPPSQDAQFRFYIQNPELAVLLHAVFGVTNPPTPRLDLDSILYPDLLKVDTSTGPVRLDMDPGFSRLSVFGGDFINSPFQGGPIPSGWPNGRRLGDDVIDIAVTAIGVGIPAGLSGTILGDFVNSNGVPYNQVFPFMGTPGNGRNHCHDFNSPALGNCP